MHFSSRFSKAIIKEKKTIDIDKVFKLNKSKEIILPLGSCFLDFFCTALQQKKYNILFDQKPSTVVNNHLRFFFGNFYNPGNLLDCLERIVLKKWHFKNHDYVYSKEFGHYINLHHKARFETQELKLLKDRIKELDSYLIKEIKKATVILLSFDSVEVWIDKLSKKTWYSFYGNIYDQKSYNNRAQLKILNYENIKNIINKIIKILNKFGEKKIILMTSPHKLMFTHQDRDIEMSDLYSKSSYTSSLTDLVSKNVSYFTALEIFNNLDEKKKYDEDFVHVKLKVAKDIFEPYFKKMYF